MRWIITCRDASKLILQQEENKLGTGEKWRLRFHLAYCYLCRLFNKQTNLITRQAPDCHEHSSACLSDQEKQELLQKLANSES